MVTQDAIQKWQNVWKHILDMTYFQKNIKPFIFIEDTKHELEDLYRWSRNDPEFEKLTFEYMWKMYSVQKDNKNNHIDSHLVPELMHVYVPGTVFQTLGLQPFMKTCFPNCAISYWED